MQKSNDETAIRGRINGDIITIIYLANQIGWKPIREQSISRTLYLASVLFTFRYGEKNINPFAEDYHFSVDATGPFYSLIKNSLVELESSGYITRQDKNDYNLTSLPLPELTLLPDYELKRSWLNTIFYILGIYGESRLYEFIIRDPQYQQHLQTNEISELNLSFTNRTVEFLNEFKNTFESTLGDLSQQISDKEYLELYFEYIFSKVLKGDIEL